MIIDQNTWLVPRNFMALCVFDKETVGVLQAFTGHMRIIERAKLKYEGIIYISKGDVQT